MEHPWKFDTKKSKGFVAYYDCTRCGAHMLSSVGGVFYWAKPGGEVECFSAKQHKACPGD